MPPNLEGAPPGLMELSCNNPFTDKLLSKFNLWLQPVNSTYHDDQYGQTNQQLHNESIKLCINTYSNVDLLDPVPYEKSCKLLSRFNF